VCCISPQALVSALILRIEREGIVPSEKELAAVLGAGCPREDMRARLVERARACPDRPFAEAIALLDAIAFPR